MSDVLSNDNVTKICDGLKMRDLDDIYLSIGSFRYTANFIINYVVGEEEKETEEPKLAKSNIESSHKSDILVDDKASILTHLAKCCNPIKGDEIVGFITKTDGIAIHRKNCSNINHTDRLVPVKWSSNASSLYVASLYVIISSDKNKLSDLIAVLTNENVNIVSIENVKENDYKVEIKVKDVDSLNSVIHKIEKLRYVKEVIRL